MKWMKAEEGVASPDVLLVKSVNQNAPTLVYRYTGFVQFQAFQVAQPPDGDWYLHFLRRVTQFDHSSFILLP